jgi:hypothetical protein
MTVGFDEKALLLDLKTWWDEQVGKDDPFALPKSAPGTIMDVLPEVDSLATVTALIVMEKHLRGAPHGDSPGRLSQLRRHDARHAAEAPRARREAPGQAERRDSH